MGWVNPSSLFRAVDQQRENETEQARLRRLAAIRSRARTTQPPMLVVLEVPRTSAHCPKMELEDRARRRLLAAIARGSSQADAAQQVGWSPSTLSRRLREDPDLRAALDEAVSARRQRIAGSRHGVAYVVRRRLRSGQVRFYSACTCGWKPLSNLTPALARKAIADHAQRERAS